MEQTKGQGLTIAYDAKRAFLNYRGLGNYCRNVLMQLAQFYPDNHYLLCTPKDKNLYPLLYNEPFETILPHGAWKLFPALWRRTGIGSSLKNRSINIYHGLSQELPHDIDQLHCKSVVTMHDAIFLRYPHLYSATYRYSFIKRNEYACRKADLIFAISEQTKKDYIHFFGVPEEKIKVVYQGCNDIYWQPVSEKQCAQVKLRFSLPDQYILSVGALEERKNQIRLIKALASAHIQIPLVLVGRGNGNYIQSLHQTAKQYNIDLRLITDATLNDLPALYSLATVFAYPSLFEGFGIPILEAARCQTPVVASKGICFEEIVGDGALYVDPLDIDELGSAIKNYIDSPDLRKVHTATALKNTERFKASQRAKDMMDAYLSLL